MKRLADENFPGGAIRALRELGRDVVAATERNGSVADSEIFAIVRREGRVLLTFDKDFGDLFRDSPLIAPSGLILFRVRRPTSPDAQRRILDVLTSDFVWSGMFCVVEPDRVRVHSPRE